MAIIGNVSRADTAVATPNAATYGGNSLIIGAAAVQGNWHRCDRWRPGALHQPQSGGTAGPLTDDGQSTVCEVVHYHFKRACACRLSCPRKHGRRAAAV